MNLNNKNFLAWLGAISIFFVNTSWANLSVEYFCPSQANEMKVLRYLKSRDIQGGYPEGNGMAWYVNLQSGASMKMKKSGVLEHKKLTSQPPQYFSYYKIVVENSKDKPTVREFKKYLLADNKLTITTGAGVGATQIYCTYTNPQDPNQFMKNDAIFGLVAWEKLGAYRIDPVDHGLVFFDVGKDNKKVVANYFTLQ